MRPCGVERRHNMAKIRIVDTDTVPVCPHCNQQLTTIEVISKGFFTQTMVYICPLYKKILSIGFNVGG